MATTKYFTEREAVRLVGMRMLANGRGTREIMDSLHICADTVYVWRRRLEDSGGDPEAAAADAPRSGRPQKLSTTQKEELQRILLSGAESAGFDGDLWTLPRVQRVIHDRFAVDFHVDHLGRLLHAIGFSPQKPVLRAVQRDEDEIRKFRDETWPSLVKKGAQRTPSSFASTRAAS
jgi:transposase